MDPSSLKTKQTRPPLCPRTQKVSVIRLQSPKPSSICVLKKSQRLPSCTNLIDSIDCLPSNQQLPQPPLPTVPTPLQKQQKDQIRQSQYQQYARRNYLRRPKQQPEELKVDSRMTEKVIVKHSPSDEGDRRLKSKSALNYAKYFIKQVSNIPTEPSSQEPAPHTGEHLAIQAGLQLSAEDKTQSGCSQSRGRLTHRAKISDRLKSLKANRTRSNKHCSIDRNLAPSLQKADKPTPKKITGNIKPIIASESLVARMKARSRNRRIVLKVRQNSMSKPDSFCLLLSSKIDRTHTAQTEITDKIELHLQLLNLLPAYVKQFKEIYEEVDCWDELLFLTYKKFFLERIKIHQALQALSPVYSPFKLPFAMVEPWDLREFNQSLAGVQMEDRVGRENELIQRALQQVYNHIIEKSGRYINLLEEDNFSEEIYWLMGEEVRLLEEREEEQGREIAQKRISLTIKCCFLIAFINGETLDIEVLLTQNGYSRQHLIQFEAFLQRIAE